MTISNPNYDILNYHKDIYLFDNYDMDMTKILYGPLLMDFYDWLIYLHRNIQIPFDRQYFHRINQYNEEIYVLFF